MAAVDLHLHTTFSDGRLTPTQLVGLCGQRGLRVISITDHDSTEAMPQAMEAAQAFPQLTVIPGVELSADLPGSELHVLGYFVDHHSAGFQGALQRFREGRQERGQRMVERLNELGLTISWSRVQELSGGGAIGRPHIAQAMVEAGYVQYPREAFERYLGRNGLAYVERLKLTPEEAIRLLVDNGALAVAAHPTYIAAQDGEDGTASLEGILRKLKEAGLVGMEVYYGDYSPEQTQRLAALATELGLIPCGGSDYHASGNPGEPEPGTVGPPVEVVEALYALRNPSLAKP